ncbi:hypothetical protein TWF481_011717 [Arthrobotrys musiformis]|uniref:Uncharacterized protein n=1 Tax=Arthrobotrys musiformis TaxID=47236 RepID=A0AAV9W212_9PEZI
MSGRGRSRGRGRRGSQNHQAPSSSRASSSASQPELPAAEPESAPECEQDPEQESEPKPENPRSGSPRPTIPYPESPRSEIPRPRTSQSGTLEPEPNPESHPRPESPQSDIQRPGTPRPERAQPSYPLTGRPAGVPNYSYGNQSWRNDYGEGSHRRTSSIVGRGSGSILSPPSGTFTTMPQEMNVQGRPKYPPGTCHPFFVQRRPGAKLYGFDLSRYHMEKEISIQENQPPFWWVYLAYALAKRAERESELQRLGRLYEDTLKEGRAGTSGTGGALERYKSPTEITNDETVEQGRKRISDQRNNAMLRMAAILGQNPTGGKSLLASLILHRRKMHQTVPYPVDRPQAIRYIVVKAAEIAMEEQVRRINKVRIRKLRKAREVGREASKRKYQSKVRKHRRSSSRISVEAPKDTSEADFSDGSTWSEFSEENSPTLPRPSAPATPRIPFAEMAGQHKRGFQIPLIPKLDDESFEEGVYTKGQPSSESQKEDFPTEYASSYGWECSSPPISVPPCPPPDPPRPPPPPPPRPPPPSPPPVPPPAPPAPPAPPPTQPRLILHSKKPRCDVIYEEPEPPEFPENDKGKSLMTLEDEIELERQRTEEYNQQQLDLYKLYLDLWRRKAGGERGTKKMWELHDHLVNDRGVAVDEPEAGTQAPPPPSRERALLLHAGKIVLQGKGPSSADFRTKSALEIFGKPTVGDLETNEFDLDSQSQISDSETLSEELPTIPSTIVVTDYDRGHVGLEILVLPEPTKDHTRPETSITHLRGDDPVRLFGRLTVEYHQALANTLQSREPDPIWKARADSLKKLLLEVRRQPLDYAMDLPVFGGLMGEFAALEMLENTATALRKAADLAEQASEQRDQAQALIYRFLDHSNEIHKLYDEAFDRQMILHQNGGTSAPMEEELDRRKYIHHEREVLQKSIIEYNEIATPSEDISAVLKPLFESIQNHTQVVEHHFDGYAPGCDSYSYAPDCPPDRPIKASRTSLPPKKPKTGRRCFHPAQILRSEVQIDAITVLGGMKGRDKNRVRDGLLKGESMERERTRLPEENWQPDFVTCGYETKPGSPLIFPVPGRMVESSKFGVFTWRTPRSTLERPNQITLPPWTRTCHGYAQMNYRKNRELYEKWQFEGWKRYPAWFLSSKTAGPLIKELEPKDDDNPPAPPQPTRQAPTSLPTHALSDGSVPEQDDDDGFIEDVEEGTITPAPGSAVGGMAPESTSHKTSTRVETLEESKGRLGGTGTERLPHPPKVTNPATASSGKDLESSISPLTLVAGTETGVEDRGLSGSCSSGGSTNYSIGFEEPTLD